MTGFAKVPPGLPVGSDGILRFKLLLVLVKDKGEWWITEYHNVAVSDKRSLDPDQLHTMYLGN
jgi:hypothetical protein